MAKLITLLVFFASAAPQAKAAVWTQNSWQGAAVSAATTSASTGWTHYESSENVVNITGSGIEIRQAVGRSWNQTNDSSGIDGFNRSGSVFSSATVSGSATAAKLTMVISDTITVKTAALAQARGDMAAVPFPGSGHIFLLGGENSDGTATKEILRYTPATDTLANSFAPLKQFTAEAAGTYHDALNTIFLFGGSSGSVLSHGILSYTPFQPIHSARRRTAFLENHDLRSVSSRQKPHLYFRRLRRHSGFAGPNYRIQSRGRDGRRVIDRSTDASLRHSFRLQSQ
jgi:hypothetical protein